MLSGTNKEERSGLHTDAVTNLAHLSNTRYIHHKQQQHGIIWPSAVADAKFRSERLGQATLSYGGGRKGDRKRV